MSKRCCDNLDVPYVVAIKLCEGTKIEIEACIKKNANRFDITLQSEDKLGAPGVIPFHISTRFSENCIVRNAIVNNAWGPEERDGGMPFKKDQYFKMEINCTPCNYTVKIDGKNFCTFNHRTSYDPAKYLVICGDLNLHRVSTCGNCKDYGIGFTQQDGYIKENNFLKRIFDGFAPGKLIKIIGQVENHPMLRFDVNLQTGNHLIHRNDIALHISARFEENCIVRNSYKNGWGKEERDGGMPIKLGDEIELVIISLPSSYEIEINGQPFCSYNHRLNHESVKYLGIEGDFVIKDVFVADAKSGFKQQPQFIETVNFMGPIVKGFHVEHSITLEGIISKDAQRFDVNLHEGNHFAERADIALQVCVNFCEDNITMHSFSRDSYSWSGENKQKCKNWLRPGQSFNMTLTRQSKSYKVDINGKFFGEFEASALQARKISIEGDLYLLSNVYFKTKL